MVSTMQALWLHSVDHELSVLSFAKTAKTDDGIKSSRIPDIVGRIWKLS